MKGALLFGAAQSWKLPEYFLWHFPRKLYEVVISWDIQTMSGWILRRCATLSVQPAI